MDWLPYVLLSLLILYALLQLVLVRQARRQEGEPAPALDELLAPELRGAERVLLYFFSPHCGPCRAVTPIVDALAALHPQVIKLDVSHRPELAQRFRVRATPTLILVERGRIARVRLGAVRRAELERWLASP